MEIIFHDVGKAEFDRFYCYNIADLTASSPASLIRNVSEGTTWRLTGWKHVVCKISRMK